MLACSFGLAPAMRAGEVLADGGYQVHRDFVDFIVDGRPLLFQLTDLDAVSPLASDVPPAIFTAQVRSLLLETDPPLKGGRYVIYGWTSDNSTSTADVEFSVSDRDRLTPGTVLIQDYDAKDHFHDALISMADFQHRGQTNC